ncbi:hypothetical protein [Actinocrispum sp. NPDC049592]|uniref:hypothetical protein n=1 Tax=Actinocrispum sp. NPDC049592 TaxID=3154835 RepID=UPI0034148360
MRLPLRNRWLAGRRGPAVGVTSLHRTWAYTVPSGFTWACAIPADYSYTASRQGSNCAASPGSSPYEYRLAQA